MWGGSWRSHLHSQRLGDGEDVLVAAPAQVGEDHRVLRHLARPLDDRGDRVARFEGGDDAFDAGEFLEGVECFVVGNDLLVNEVAPRPHNSGHQTIEANMTYQYEQHLRSILNLPLGNTDIIMPSAMVNLLGEAGYAGPAKYQGFDEVIREDGVYVHLYGKKLTKPFRKMGHVTIIARDIDDLKKRVTFVKETLKVIA